MADNQNLDAMLTATSWDGIPGPQVREFLQAKLSEHDTSKASAFLVRKINDVPMLFAFASVADRAAWEADPELNADKVIDSVELPNVGKQTENSYSVALKRDGDGTVTAVDGVAVVRLRFSSMERDPEDVRSHFDEDGLLTIERRLNDSQQWQKCGTLTMRSVSDSSTAFTDIDVAQFLPQGTWQVRMRVKSQTSDLNTGFVSLNVAKITLSLAFCNAWQTPIRGSVMPLNYTYNGGVAKHLNLRISGVGGIRELSFPLGAGVSADSPRTFEVDDSNGNGVRVMSHGIHTIEAWLSVDGSTSESEHIKSQVMVVADESDQTPYVIANNAAENISTWTQAKMFDYAVYNPSGEAIPLKILVKDPNTNTAYIEFNEAEVTPGEVRSFANVIETESEDRLLAGVVNFVSGGEVIGEELNLNINNPEGFAPVKGADFILNPKQRSNSEANPATIINGKDGLVVPATFNGFGFISDGWVTDADGTRCLRIPAKREVNINFGLLSDFIGGTSKGKTSSLCFDIVFAVRNVSDESAPVIRSCSYDAQGVPMGLEVRPLEGVFMTQGNTNRDDQGVAWGENKRIHLCVALVYNANQSGFNYCRTYINGVINKEFAYDSKAVFVDGSNAPGIILGGLGADIDIYSMYVYRKELSARNIEQNHLASLPTSEEKIAFKAANNIFTDGLIDYEKASIIYNTVKWVGQYATYGNTKKDAFPGYLKFHQVDLPEYSGTVTGLLECGQGTSSMLYHQWNARFKEDKSTGMMWTDEKGVQRGAFIQLGEGLPKAKVNDGKINWASSMQSHKIGACNLYNDLYKAIIGGSSVTQVAGFEDCRFAVNQKPFLFFTQENEEALPVFRGFMTLGPSKSDLPTFGFDAERFPDYLGIEGADNDKPLVMGRVPWNEDIVLNGEDWTYAGEKQFSLLNGDTSKISFFADAFNAIYSTYFDIDYHIGDYETLKVAENLDTDKHYWVTRAGANNNQFDLFRYDSITKGWVHAGIEKLGAGSYAAMNINTQCGNIASGANWSNINAAFKAKRLQMFKETVGNFFNIDAILFLLGFLKVIGASDNWGKNWYLFVDPTTHLISFFNDDLDTILPIDNVGTMKKPYDVEEHDKDAKNTPYWNSAGNALFNSIEQAFGAELRNMLHTILSAMATLGGTPYKCMEKYFFAVQEYFPASAYNETSRVQYEKAYPKWVDGSYQNGTNPLKQSNGDSLEREKEWAKRRIAYLSSLAMYGEFGCKDGGQSAGSLNFRSVVKRNGNKCSYRFAVTPRLSMYPSFAKGQTLSRGTADDQPKRVKAGETFEAYLGEADGNTDMFINGINYMNKVGNFYSVALGETFGLSGDNLTEFIVDGEDAPEFRPASMTVSARNLKRLVICNVPELSGELDVAELTQLEELDLRGTSLIKATLPNSENLRIVRLPATLKSLTLEHQPNLAEVSIAGAASLTEVSLASGVPNVQAIVEKCANDKAPLTTLTIGAVNWRDVKLATLLYFAEKNATLSGKITLAQGQPLGFYEKVKLVAAFGNIDDRANTLFVDYGSSAVPLDDAFIMSDTYIETPGNYECTLLPSNESANTVTGIEWSIENNAYATINSRTGMLKVTNTGAENEDGSGPQALVTCVISQLGGNTTTRTKLIHFHHRTARVGDLVFHDGSYGTENDLAKTPIGVCFWTGRDDEGNELREMVCLNRIDSCPWGLTDDLKNTAGQVVFSYNLPMRNLNTGADPSDASLLDSTGTEFKVFPTNVYAGQLGFAQLTRDFSILEGTGEPTSGAVRLPTTKPTKRVAEGSALPQGYEMPGAKQDFPLGLWMPYGQYMTLQIIAWRNDILRSTDPMINKLIPAATDTVDESTDLDQQKSTISLGDRYYFRAASRCYAYEPGMKRKSNILAPQFRAHNWFLPTLGELMRIQFYMRHSADADGKWNAFKKWVHAGVLSKPGKDDQHWSTSENADYPYFAWRSSQSGLEYNYKDYGCSVRAIAAF